MSNDGNVGTYSSPKHDTEDKEWWVKKGMQDEAVFVEDVAAKIGLAARLNPAKAENPYAPDLVVNGKIADLKHQTTPFFTAGVKYGLTPRFAVTLNRNDYRRYVDHYPAIDIYFWVDWAVTEAEFHGRRYRVEPLEGIWLAYLPLITECIHDGKAPLHPYQRRVDDEQGNAKWSYVLDLRWFECLWSTDSDHYGV